MPVTRMAGKLQRLNNSVTECVQLGIETIIIHDIRDAETEIELRELETRFDSNLVKVFTEKIGSPGITRNLGILNATGSWISFWDSDDKPLPYAFKSMVENAQLAKKKVAVGSFKFLEEEKNQTKTQSFGSSLKDIGRMPGIWRFAFSREFIGSTRFTEYSMGEDQVFLASLNIDLNQIYHSPDVVYLYDNHFQGQLTGNLTAIAEVRQACKAIIEMDSLEQTSNEIAMTFLSRLMLTRIKHSNVLILGDWIRDLKKSRVKFGKGFYAIFFNIFTSSIIGYKKK